MTSSSLVIHWIDETNADFEYIVVLFSSKIWLGYFHYLYISCYLWLHQNLRTVKQSITLYSSNASFIHSFHTSSSYGLCFFVRILISDSQTTIQYSIHSTRRCGKEEENFEDRETVIGKGNKLDANFLTSKDLLHEMEMNNLLTKRIFWKWYEVPGRKKAISALFDTR